MEKLYLIMDDTENTIPKPVLTEQDDLMMIKMAEKWGDTFEEDTDLYKEQQERKQLREILTGNEFKAIPDELMASRFINKTFRLQDAIAERGRLGRPLTEAEVDGFELEYDITVHSHLNTSG